MMSDDEMLHFERGIKEITDKLYSEHTSDIDTEVYVYTSLGEYSRDHSRILVHTTVIEDDVSPFRPESAEYAWYGAGVLDTESGMVEESETSDILAYNKANGIMWLVFSGVFWISTILGFLNMRTGGICLIAGGLVGVPILILVYGKIYDKFKTDQNY